jgi:hypothetical protein
MKLSTVFFTGFVVLTIALALKTHQLGQALIDERSNRPQEIREAEQIGRALRERLHALRPPPLSLMGRESTSNQKFSIEAVDSIVLYYFGPMCPFSSGNVPFLNRLHGAGVDVVGIAPEEQRPAIVAFARTSGTDFPLLTEPTGEVIDVLPRGAVPLTAVFLNGRMEALWLGPLNEGRQQQLAGTFGIHLGGG